MENKKFNKKNNFKRTANKGSYQGKKFNPNFKKKINSNRYKYNKFKNLEEEDKKTINQEGLYLTDTSIVAQKKLFRIFKDKLRGTLLVPNAVIAELENLANKGFDAGFLGLEEIAKLHKLRPRLKISFIGERPNQHQIKYAKSGEIDAMIRDMAYRYKATLITADLVQAKSAEAYGIKVIFVKTKIEKKKKVSFFRKILKK
jgi:predicted PilT family ATPase